MTNTTSTPPPPLSRRLAFLLVLLPCLALAGAALFLPYVRYNAWPSEKQLAKELRGAAYGKKDPLASPDYCLPQPGTQLCSGRSFDSLAPGVACFVPKCQWGHVTDLSLGRAGLDELADKIGELPGLVTLDLHGNRLTTLPAAIGELHHLKRLDLSDNHLTSLPAEIGQLQQLEELDLSGNQLVDLPPELGRLQDLKSLKLSNNRMLEIPAVLKQLESLSYLDVDGNPLHGPLPEFLAGMPLQYFMFSKTQACVPVDEKFQAWIGGISSVYMGAPYLPTQVCSLTGDDQAAMLALYEAAGRPEAWDPQVLPCTWDGVGCDLAGHVIYLRFLPDALSSLPPEIGLLRELQSLVMGYSRVEQLPPEIGQLHKLSLLDLSHNRLTSLPPEIGQLRSLRTLYLPVNQLRLLPPELGQLVQLEYLDVSGNPLSGPLPHFLAGMQALKFEFTGTGFCVPDDPQLLSWLERQVTGYYLVQGTEMKYVPVDPHEAIQRYLADNGCG